MEGEGGEGEGGEGEGTEEGEGIEEGEGDTDHSSDINGDGRIDLSELLRAIQIYNFIDRFGCGDDDDGFSLGSSLRDCPRHSMDYLEPFWEVTLSELLRVVQLFNVGDIVRCKDSEDGFCTRLRDE